MKKYNFANELERVLSRPDIDVLRRALTTHHQYDIGVSSGLEPEWTEYCDFVGMAGTGLVNAQDYETALALVILAASTIDDIEYLGFMAAGPLENALLQNDQEFVDRIVAEAGKSQRFRWMLSGVYLHAIHSDNVEPVRIAIGEMSISDPLPPRPWA